MKKIPLLLLFILSLNLNAQISFTAPGATWHYILSSGGWGAPYAETNETAQYKKDSLFMGKQVKVITDLNNFKTTCSNAHDTTLIYTSNDSVFFHNISTLHTWELLYCFNTPHGQK